MKKRGKKILQFFLLLIIIKIRIGRMKQCDFFHNTIKSQCFCMNMDCFDLQYISWERALMGYI